MNLMKKYNFWKNKNVLITGHTGFKGSWLTLLLYSFGAKVTGYAKNPISKPNFFDDLALGKFLKKDFRENITDLEKLNKVIKRIKPSVIFHLVGQSSVLQSYKDPLDTVNANVIGTVNLLQAARSCKSVKSIVLVTSDKVYLNLEEKKKFKEADKLGGYDLYSSSKAACDILEIDTFIECSSNLAIKPYLAGQDRIIEISKRLEATDYLNLPGGKDLYDEAKFKSCELNLRFLRLPNVFNREESKNIYFQSILGLISTFGLDQVKEIIHSSSGV